MKSIFQQIADKQKQYKELPKQINELIDSVQGMEIDYKGQIATVLSIYTDRTVDLLIYDEEHDEDKEINVKLEEI